LQKYKKKVKNRASEEKNTGATAIFSLFSFCFYFFFVPLQPLLRDKSKKFKLMIKFLG